MIAFPVPVFSAIEAVWLPVIAISTSVTVTVTVIVSVLAPSVTESTTTQVFALFPAPHPGASKLGAAANDSAPLFATMLNKSWSTEAPLSPTATME